MQNVIHKSAIPARADIETPLPLCRYLTDLILSVMTPKVILDPSAGNDNLTHYFSDQKIIRFEIKDDLDFFDAKQIACDLVVCNPPFNGMGGGKLFPEEFLKHIINVVPPNTPIVLITPHGLRHNVRKKSPRLSFLDTLNITSLITLPLDVFDGVLFHTEVLILNLPRLKSHYTYLPTKDDKTTVINLKSVNYKLNRFITIDKTLLNLCQTLAFTHGLQSMAGNLLAALIYSTDDEGYIAINEFVRDALAIRMNSTKQVVVNQLKALSDVNLLTKVKRGHYFFEPISAKDCRKIKEGVYQTLSLDFRYQNTQLLPGYNIMVE
tara:strand:+ start:64983 stop:65948 length:966 start_codon:yes stop_codon:yes gene_type:complete